MFKFVAGSVVGLVVAGLFFLSMLPGAPSNYGPRFPMAKTPLPKEAVDNLESGIIGLDVYWSTKAPPIFKKDESIPFKKSSLWSGITQQNGIVYLNETAWVEYQGKLYPVFHFKNLLKKIIKALMF